MADAKQYAEWLVANKHKKGTSEFDAVAAAYMAARSEAPPPPTDTKPDTGGEPVFPVSPAVARYAAPMALGIAAMPLTAGMSAVPAALTMAGVGAGSQAVGSTIAELMEMAEGKPEMDKRQMAAEIVTAGTPFKSGGRLLSSAATNIMASLATSEIGRFMQMGDDYSLKSKDSSDAIVRWGLPIAMPASFTAIGAGGRAAKNVSAATEELRKSRLGGSVMVTDILPFASDLEAERISKGSRVAYEGYMGMDPQIGAKIAEEFQPVLGNEKIAAELNKSVGLLDKLQAGVASAQDNAARLAQAHKDAANKLLDSHPALKVQARDAAFESVKLKAVYERMVEDVFGGVAPELTAVAKGRRMETLSALAKGAKEAAGSAVGELYAKAGLGPNVPVVSKNFITAHIAQQGAKGMPLEGDIARSEIIQSIDDVFGDRPVLTLEGFRQVRDQVAAKLTKEGKDPKAVNRIAASVYKAISSASDDFIKANMPEQFAAWKTAQAAASAEINARATDAIEMVAKGDADGLWKSIKSEGAGPVMKQLNAYTDIIASTFDAANPNSIAASKSAADAFKRGVNTMLRDAAVDRAVDKSRKLGFSGEMGVVDVSKLVGELQELSSRGYDVSLLGLGTKKDIAALARLGAKAESGGYTVKDIDRWMKDLRSVGGDAATARAKMNQAIVQEFMSPDRKRAAIIAKNLADSSKRAKLSAEELANAYREAAADPLVQLLNKTGMGTSPDVINNMTWAERLMSVGPETAGDFVKAMKAKGRTADLENINKALTVSVMRTFEPDVGGVRARLNLKGINELFYGANPKEVVARETLRAIIGSEEYSRLMKFAQPVHEIMGTRELLRQSGLEDPAIFNNAVRIKAKLGGGFMSNIPVFSAMQSLYRSGKYHTLHLLFVNPKWAPRFANAGYDMSKFASQPANATMLKMAQDDDNRAGQPAEAP